LPAAISVDNGTEFTARALDHWAYTHRVELDYSRPGKPIGNTFIEAFNSLVRRECLSQHYSSTLEEARHVLKAQREEYNNHRPHGSLGDRTPAEY
jgi:putative transposase